MLVPAPAPFHSLKKVIRTLVTATAVGACVAGAPSAMAQQVPLFNTQQLVEQAAQAVQSVEVPAHNQAQVDDLVGVLRQAQSAAAAFDANANATVAQALDQAYDQALTNPNPLGLAELEKATQQGFKPLAVDPNYVWKNDLFSKVAAGKPQAEYVLHRVPGSLFDAPRTPEESNKAMTRGNSLYGPGTPLYINRKQMCTLTAAGYDSRGRKVGISAGHCGEVGQQVSSADSWQVGPTGTIVAKNTYLDYSVIEFNDKAELTASYNGVKAYGVGEPLSLGQVTCKRGVATGTTCGQIFASDSTVQLGQVCAMQGDSGAPLFKNGKVVGLVTGGLGNFPCRTPLQGFVHTPATTVTMRAVLDDLNRRGQVGAGFRLAN